MIVERENENMRLCDLYPKHHATLTEAPGLDPNNPIDQELSRTAKNVDNNGSLDQDDIDAQSEPTDAPESDTDMEPMGADQNVPDDAMGGAEGAKEPIETKPLDSALMSLVRDHDYIQRYDHSDTSSETHPAAIMGMDMSDLTHLRQRLRGKLDQIGLEDNIGKYANPKTKAAQDMMSFVDTILAQKKQVVKNNRSSPKNPARFRTRKSSKIKNGKKFKPKHTK